VALLLPWFATIDGSHGPQSWRYREVPYLRVANVQRGYLDLSVIKNVTRRRADWEPYALRLGDALMTEGGDRDKLGRAAIWREEIRGCIHRNRILCVRPPSEEDSQVDHNGARPTSAELAMWLEGSKRELSVPQLRSEERFGLPIFHAARYSQGPKADTSCRHHN